MIIKNIKLNNFRNYDKLFLNFDKHLNIIIGKNAQGKTNILESIYVLALTKSYQKISDRNLIKFDNKFSKIVGDITVNGFNKCLEVLINEKEKKVKINNDEIKKFYNYVSTMNVVLFTPDDIKIFKESPNSRRRILNIELSQINNNYINLINNYNLILKQRNEYLKIESINFEYLDILNKKYASLAIEIYNYRLNFINSINNVLKDIYKDITGFDDLELKYISNIDYCEDKEKMKLLFLQKINSNFTKEKIYGNSLFGPHRDDFSFYLNNRELALYGSQGQLRTAILSFKLAEIEIIKNKIKEYPILLLDDVFSELDNIKKSNIIKYLKDDLQTIITTTDIDMIDKKIVNNSKIITISNGNVIKQEGKKENE